MMDVEKSSLCNCVVNFLLEENYLLTAFELLHELLDDGRDDQAIRLKNFFSDSSQFPPDQISRFNTLRVADPQTLLQENEAVEEKLAITEYELRLAQEDISKFKTELQKQAESPVTELRDSESNASVNNGPQFHRQKTDVSFSDLGPLKDNERRDLNCAVKEYLLIAGYRLTAMTFFEEVTDQNLDVWQNSPACVPDALRHYYYQYLSSTTEAAEEKISMLRKNESLLEENEKLNHEKMCLVKNKDMAEGQISALNKSLESLQKDLKDKENLVQDLRQSLEHQRKELNGCRAEVTALKMHIEGSRLGQNMVATDVDQSLSLEKYKDEVKSLQMELEILRSKIANAPNYVDSTQAGKESMQMEEKVVVMDEEKSIIQHPDDAITKVVKEADHSIADDNLITPKDVSEEYPVDPSNGSGALTNGESVCKQKDVSEPSTSSMLHPTTEDHSAEIISEKRASFLYLLSSLFRHQFIYFFLIFFNFFGIGWRHVRADSFKVNPKGLETIHILADALPKIVPYVLINHREELLPLIMCAIERHPESSTRDSLTHTLFNLIKRPDEQQRRIIMDACVSLAQNVGEMRTETELLPQCWEQINHTYEERRLLVAQSCGELAEFVRPEIRDSLILSIVQQLIEDSATVVREAAVHNLALLLPLFPNMDKYFKVEELMFQLVCDPSGVVVETTLKELVPAVIKWGQKLDHVLRVLLSYILSSAERCPPLSGVEGSVESHLRVLGERERWNADVLLRMLLEMLPSVHQKAIEMSPFSSDPETTGTIFSTPFLELYAGGHVQLPAFEWLHVDCFPDLIQLACFLPPKEDTLRNRITRFLLAVSELYGDFYLTHIMLPVFLIAIGEDAQLTYFPSSSHSKIEGLAPRTAVAKRLATMCILPLFLAGVLGAPSKREQLVEYLRKLLVGGAGNQSTKCNTEIVDAVRFLCTFEIHHGMIFNILWEMVVSSNIDMKINAANLLKVIVPYIDAKVASTNILPALVTLGSDQNLSVKYASIVAFGAVAQHFKNDMIVDKIRVQMDAFLEDGSHEATIAVVHALVVAVPHTTDRLKDYLLSKIFHLTGTLPANDMMRRRERANAFCEAIRALDATDISATSVRDYLLPTIQNLLKDSDALDPVHKEALEIIMKERSGGTFETISKVMGAGLASSVSSFFGEGGLLGKKDNVEPLPEPVESPKSAPTPPAEDTRLRRIMRGNFTDMLRGKVKGQDETQNQ